MLSATDNANQTITYAVDAAGTWGVYHYRLSGVPGEFTPTLAATIAGPGQDTAAAPKGAYVAYAVSGSTVSNSVFLHSTDGLAAVATRLRASLEARFALCLLPCTENIYGQIFPDDMNAAFPCVLLTYEGQRETIEPALNGRDDWGRPVQVLVLDRADKYEHDRLPDYEDWRQALTRSVIHQRVPGLPESVITRVEPLDIVNPTLPAYKHLVTGFVVRAVTREPRGLGA